MKESGRPLSFPTQHYLLILFVAIFAFFPAAVDTRVGKEILFSMAIALIAILKFTEHDVPLRLLALTAATSSFFYRNVTSFETFLLMLGGLYLYSLARDMSEAHLKDLLRVYCVALVLLVGVQATGLFENVYVTFNPNRPFSGFTGSTSDTAAALASILPLIAGTNPGLFLLGAAVLIYMKSVVAVVALLVAMGVLFHKKVREFQFWYLWIGAVAILTLPYWQEEMFIALTDDRWRAWYIIVRETWTKAALTGFGLASFSTTFGGFVTGRKDGVLQVDWFAQAHNEYFQMFYELGFVGLFLLVAVLVFAIHRARKNIPLVASLAAIAVCAFGHFTFHTVITAIPIILVMALVDRRRGW